jgi:hypothetical protein
MQEIIQGMLQAQRLQDEEGASHPGETQVYTFQAPFLIRLWLRLRRYEGLTFVKYAGEVHGIFRAVKR